MSEETSRTEAATDEATIDEAKVETDSVETDEVDTTKASTEKTGVAKKAGAAKKTGAVKKAGAGEQVGTDKTVKVSDQAGQAKPLRGGGREFTITARNLLQAGLGLLLVAALVLIGVGAWQLYEKNKTLNAFDDAKAASSAFVQTYFGTVMSKDASPESVIAKVVPLSTGEARERVESEAKSNVNFVQQAKLENIEIKVNASTVESFTADRATTVLAVAIKGTSATQPAGGQQVVLLQLDLAKQDGTWLVSRMSSVEGMSMDAGSQQAPAAPAPAPAPTG